MGLWEFEIRASYEYPFIELSRNVSDTPISMWCMWDHELLQIPHRDPELLRQIERAVRKAGRIVDHWVDAHSARLFVLKCTCDRFQSPWNLMDAHQCWDEPPIVYRDGWVNFRVLSFESKGPSALYQDLRERGKAELLRKRELGLDEFPTNVWTHALFRELTARQSEALLTAHRFGYYFSPRAVTANHIAASLGLGRTTYEEHLRKAENRVISTLMPLLEIYSRSNPRRGGLGPKRAEIPRPSKG
jgi:predicted DNA binding protein